MDGDFKRPLGTNNTGVPAPATTSGFEGSPETYENAEGAPVEAVKEPQEMKEKKPGKFKKFMLRFLLVLAVLGLAAAAGWFWYDGQNAKNELSDVKSKVAELQTTASRYKLALEETTKTPAKTQDVSTTILNAAQSHYDVASGLVAFRETSEPVRSEFKVVKQESGFAKVSFKNPLNNTTDFAILKKDSNEIWKVVADNVLVNDTDSNSTNDTSYVSKRYGIPASMTLKP